mmetsp:Transcript_17762/g.31662  ORF Transcript_17762/g.31662 Transcript_17762/m.31662 type:complete len:204 (-) Transcript_17762:16-627(-)
MSPPITDSTRGCSALAKGASASGTSYEMVSVTLQLLGERLKKRMDPLLATSMPTDMEPGTDLQWIFCSGMGAKFWASHESVQSLPNCVVFNVQRLIFGLSSSILTLSTHGIQLGISVRSSHSAHASSTGTSTSTEALFSIHCAALHLRPLVHPPGRRDPATAATEDWVTGRTPRVARLAADSTPPPGRGGVLVEVGRSARRGV